jgi:hypothetical protein
MSSSGRTEEKEKEPSHVSQFAMNYATASSPMETVLVSGGDGPSLQVSGFTRDQTHPLDIENADGNGESPTTPDDEHLLEPSYLIPATIIEDNPERLAARIVEQFNKPNTGPKALTQTSVLTFPWGKRIAKYEFLLAHHNFQPELATHSPYLWTTTSSLFDWSFNSEIIGIYNLSQRTFNAYNRYVLHVQANEYVKAIKNGKYVIFNQGTHVFSATSFIFNPETDVVKKSENHIEHGDIHILRVPAGKLAKVEKDSGARFFKARSQPYFFQDPNFKFDGYVDETEKYIAYKSLKYIMPGVNEAAVIFHEGVVELRPARGDGKPIILSLATDSFEGFVSTVAQTLQFPSAEAIAKKREDKNSNPDEDINYSYFVTADSFKVGIKVSIDYVVSNPVLTLKQGIKIPKITEYIETLIRMKLTSRLKQYHWRNFLNSTNAQPLGTSNSADLGMTADPASTNSMNTIEESLTWALATELSKVGIEFKGMAFDIRNIFDKEEARIYTLASVAFSLWQQASHTPNISNTGLGTPSNDNTPPSSITYTPPGGRQP